MKRMLDTNAVDGAAWDRVIATNLKASFFCLKAEAIQVKAQGSGAILFNGSILAEIAQSGTSVYSASKGRRRIARARRRGRAGAIRHPGEYHQRTDHADPDDTGTHHERPGR